MRVIIDTNILVWVATRDDEKQARAAAKILKSAEHIAIPLTSLCEFVWVLRRVYSFGLQDILLAMDALLNAKNIVVNRAAVDAGLAMLKAGGDFADGLIAHEGTWLGGEVFVSFDKKAVSLLAAQGQQAELLA